MQESPIYGKLVEAEHMLQGFQNVHSNTQCSHLETARLLSAPTVVRTESMPAPIGVGAREICMGIALTKRICEAHFIPERRAGTLKTLSLVCGIQKLPKLVRLFPGVLTPKPSPEE